MAWHYIAKVMALTIVTISLVVTFRAWDVSRIDTTEGQVSSLAPTKKLIRELDSDQPIVIDAFVSTEIPEIYARTRYKLINLLKEFRSEAAKGGRKLEKSIFIRISNFLARMRHLRKNALGSSPLRERSVRKGRRNRKPLSSERLSALGWKKSRCLSLNTVFRWNTNWSDPLTRSHQEKGNGSAWFRVMP